VSIPTENGILIRTGIIGNTFSLRLKHGTVTAPQVTESTTLYFRLDITSRRSGRTPDRQSAVVSVTVNVAPPPTASTDGSPTSVSAGDMVTLDAVKAAARAGKSPSAGFKPPQPAAMLRSLPGDADYVALTNANSSMASFTAPANLTHAALPAHRHR